MYIVPQFLALVLLILPSAYTEVIVSTADINESTYGWSIDGIIQNILKCIRSELSWLSEIKYDKEIKINDDIKFSHLILNGLMDWTTSLTGEIDWKGAHIIGNITWKQIVFNTDYDIALETMGGNGKISVKTNDLNIYVNITRDSKGVHVHDYNILHKSEFDMSNFYMGHINVGDRLKDLLEEHPDELLDIINYVQKYYEEHKIAPVMQPFMKLTYGVKDCFKLLP